MVYINNIDDQRVSLYRDLKSKKEKHCTEGLFVAEGIKVVRQLLKSKLEITSVFALEEFYRDYAAMIDDQRLPEEVKYVATKELMKTIVGFRIHSGIMMVAKEPEPSGLAELGDRIVVLNGIIDSENVGAITRNCTAFGFDSLIIDEATSSPYLRRAVRVSMGTVFYTKIHYSKNIVESLEQLRDQFGFKVIGAEITNNSIPVDDFVFSGKYAIVFGAESQGVKKEVLDLCDDLVFIPINPLANSINVAASSAVILRKAASGPEQAIKKL